MAQDEDTISQLYDLHVDSREDEQDEQDEQDAPNPAPEEPQANLGENSEKLVEIIRLLTGTIIYRTVYDDPKKPMGEVPPPRHKYADYFTDGCTYEMVAFMTTDSAGNEIPPTGPLMTRERNDMMERETAEAIRLINACTPSDSEEDEEEEEYSDEYFSEEYEDEEAV